MQQATTAAVRGDWTGCLSALLAAWRETKDPALAALIERVSVKAAGPPVAGAGSVSTTVQRRIASATDADVAPILELAQRQLRTFPRAYTWIVQLAAARPADPRIASALAALVERPAFKGVEGALVPDVIEALDAIDDPRYRAMLVDAWETHEPHRGRIRKQRRGLDLLKGIAQAIATRPAPAKLEGLAAAAKQIDAALDGAKQPRGKLKPARDLLQAIYDDPADTSLRLVYADALQDQGDPRGEFIALQCARAGGDPPSQRERELLRTHGRTWLGEIEPIVNKQGVVYRRGFLACAREGQKLTKHDALLRAPIWSTVEELDLSPRMWGDKAVAFVTDPRWKALRRVFNVYAPDDVPALAKRGKPLPWTTLGVRYPAAETWPLIARTWPALEELDLAGVDEPVAAIERLGKKLASRLHRVRVATRRSAVADLVAAARAAGIAELELVVDYSFPGDPEGSAVRIAGDRVTLVQHDAKLDGRHATAVLDALPAKSVRSATLEAPRKLRIEDAAWTVLEKALRRHGIALARPPDATRAAPTCPLVKCRARSCSPRLRA